MTEQRTRGRTVVSPIDYVLAPEAPMTDDPAKRRNYRIELPNIVDDSDMSPFTFRLYAHVKRVAGPCGSCDQGTRELARACKMSVGQVTKSKQELIDGGWVTASKKPSKGGMVDSLKPVDLWEQNYATYARSEPIHDVNTNDESVHTVNTKQEDSAVSVHTVNESVHQVNERINNKNKHDHESVGASRDTSPPQESKAKKEKPTPKVIREAMADVCKIELRGGPKGQIVNLNNVCKTLWEQAQRANVSAEGLAERIRYAGDTYWYKYDWRGKKQERPQPHLIHEEWRAAMEQYNARKNGTPTYTAVERPPRVTPEQVAAARAKVQGGK